MQFQSTMCDKCSLQQPELTLNFFSDRTMGMKRIKFKSRLKMRKQLKFSTTYDGDDDCDERIIIIRGEDLISDSATPSHYAVI